MSTAILDMPLREVKQRLLSRLDEGTKCPACNQFAKVYRRKITAPMAKVLIAMWRAAGWDFIHLPSLGLSRGDEAKARYWGLIEEYPDGEREDGSTRVGVWRLTSKGVSFVHNRLRVPKYALIYDGKCLYLDDDETVSISDALGTKFNYRELMEGV